MNLFLIDHETHDVVKSQSYDTYDSEQDERDFLHALQNSKKDQIIVIILSDEGTNILKNDTKEYIASLGSQLIRNLGYR